MFRGISSKSLAIVHLIVGLLISAAISYHIGLMAGNEIIWVAREKIMGAAQNIPLEQFNLVRAVVTGVICFVFLAAGCVVRTALYYEKITFYRNGRNIDCQ